VNAIQIGLLVFAVVLIVVQLVLTVTDHWCYFKQTGGGSSRVCRRDISSR
jgi:hypothetical protein